MPLTCEPPCPWSNSISTGQSVQEKKLVKGCIQTKKKPWIPVLYTVN